MGDLTRELLLAVALAVALAAVVVLAIAAFAAVVHGSWVAKERLLARLAARMGVPYETRVPWHVRAWRWWLR